MKVGLRLAIAATLCWVLAAHALSYEGLVVKVKDGDTVTLLDSDKRSHEVRLAGIDAPEKGQAFGQRSKQSLSDLAYMQKATVHFDKKDRYGREVGKVLVNERDVNLEQIDRVCFRLSSSSMGCLGWCSAMKSSQNTRSERP